MNPRAIRAGDAGAATGEAIARTQRGDLAFEPRTLRTFAEDFKGKPLRAAMAASFSARRAGSPPRDP